MSSSKQKAYFQIEMTSFGSIPTFQGSPNFARGLYLRSNLWALLSENLEMHGVF